MERKTAYWLIAIVLITFISRLTFALLVPNFTYESYFHLRQVEYIEQTGLPLFSDPLSYGGRNLTFLPLFHYLMALFALIIPLKIVATILPNIFLSLLPIIVFFISRTISKSEEGSLFAALLTGFLPILFSTANSFSTETLLLPLLFLTIYAFLHISERKYLYIYIITFLISSLTSPVTFLLIMGFIIYILLSILESKKIDKAEVEVILFSFLFFVWIQFLFFKRLFAQEGLSFIWQNVPKAIISEYFPTISLPQAVVLVSVVPFLAGIYVVYRALFQLHNTRAFLLISFVISTSLLAWFRLIPFQISLMFFGVVLAILFSTFYEELRQYLAKTKFVKKNWLAVCMVLLLIPTMFLPAALSASRSEITPTDNEILAFQWLADHTPEKAGVLARLDEGHLITYYSSRRNMIDDQFRLIKDVNSRFEDVNVLYHTTFQTQAIGLLDKYNIQYIVLTSHAQETEKLEKFRYLTKKCFDLVYNNFEENYDGGGAQIYQNHCTIRELH